MTTAQYYSLKKRLLWGASIFSLLLGCLLIFAAYRMALHEVNEILDTQMQYMAEHTAAQSISPLASRVELHHNYREEDLLVDIWAYKDQSHLRHPTNLLLAPVQQAGFYTQHTRQGAWRVYVIPLKDYQIQVSQQEKVRSSFALELAGSMFIPYVLLLPLALFILAFIIRRSLKPLNDFKAELAQRDSESLAPIDRQDYPQ